jgi:hypothetical protein
MPFLEPVRDRLRDLVRSERGMALPVALFAMIASMALASAAVMATIDVQQGSHRDSSSKSAIAAADAGVNVARLRMAHYAYVLNTTTPCLTVGTSGLLEGSKAETIGGVSWCPSVSGTVGGSTYSYRTSPVGVACGTYNLCVVATGTADGVSRRVEVTFNTSGTSGTTGTEGKEKAGASWATGVGIDGLIGSEKVDIDNKGEARVNIGTNGDVIVHPNGTVCGNIRHGVGKKAIFENNANQCKGYEVIEGNVTVPPVSSFMPSNIATVNSNFRLVKCTKTKPVAEPTGCQSDSYTGSWTGNIPWNSSTRTISTANNTTLTIGSPGSATDYFACKLELSNNSHFIMPAGAMVRIFFDTPENCKLSSGAKQIEIGNNADITSTGYQPTLGKYDLPGFYLTGSTSIPTKIEWSNNSGSNEFVLYAPNTEVLISNNATFTGIIAGKSVHLENAIIRQDSGFVLPGALNPWKESAAAGTTGEPAPTALYYSPQSYVECSGGSTSGLAPNANC